MTIFCKLIFAFQGRTHYLNLYVELWKEGKHPKNFKHMFLLCVWQCQAAAQSISTDVHISTNMHTLLQSGPPEKLLITWADCWTTDWASTVSLSSLYSWASQLGKLRFYFFPCRIFPYQLRFYFFPWSEGMILSQKSIVPLCSIENWGQIEPDVLVSLCNSTFFLFIV